MRAGRAADNQGVGWIRRADVRAARPSLLLSERKILLFVADLAIINIALALSLAWRFGLSPVRQVIQANPGWFLILTGLWVVLSFLLDAYDLRRAARFGSGVGLGAIVALATALAFLFIPRYTPPLPTSRVSLMVFLGGLVGGVAAWRGIYALLLIRPWFRRKALIVGAGWAGRTIAQAIRDHAGHEYDLVGFIDDDPSKHDTAVEGVPVLGGSRDLPIFVDRPEISDLIVAITHTDRMDSRLFQTIMDCHERGLQVSQMAILYEQLTGRVAVEHAGRDLHVILPLYRQPTRFYRSVKWLLDMAFGVVGLAMMIVLMPLVAIAQWLEGPGPIFYRQVRVGRGGQPFALLKFRTMRPDAEPDGPQWAREGDFRTTRVGKLIRRLHLDEVPQAINILLGQLSFIGPRPERPEFGAQLEAHVPFYRTRHAVAPGITGWAQVNYPYGSSVGDALSKLQYDLYYIKHQSLWLDLIILAKTIGHVLSLRGR